MSTRRLLGTEPYIPRHCRPRFPRLRAVLARVPRIRMVKP